MHAVPAHGKSYPPVLLHVLSLPCFHVMTISCPGKMGVEKKNASQTMHYYQVRAVKVCVSLREGELKRMLYRAHMAFRVKVSTHISRANLKIHMCTAQYLSHSSCV